jgi:peptidoglycan hydrolase CwlO-like protein
MELMARFWKRVFVAVALAACLVVPSAQAINPEEELQQQINETQRLLDMSKNATTPLEAEVANLAKRIQNAKNTIANLRAEQKKKDAEIKAKEVEMADQYALFSSRVDQQYRFGRTYSPLAMLLSAASSDSQQALKYTLTLASRDQQSIDAIGQNILDLQRAKVEAQEQEKRLASLQAQLDEQSDKFEKDIAGAKAYQATLTAKIADLSARQQAILAAKTGTYTTSVGDVPLADDFNASIGYKGQAPSDSFAVFSFGAYTHRNGMSQYGAKNLADQGKSYRDIIQWYYGHGVKKDDGLPGSINVQGYGEMSYQTYLYGLAEMPSNFHPEALKAQAIAARTYASRANKPICTTEACQVFNKGKSENPPEAWKKAVDDTEKEIIDGDVTAQYASSHGGYTNTTGWDTSDRSGNGDWASRATEKSDGPWFYKAWYRQGYSKSGANCGKEHPWMSQEEFSDIINAWIVRYKKTDGVDQGRILPVSIGSCNIGGQGGDPYSMSELRDKGGVSNVSSVSVSHSDKGQTTNVKVVTNSGTYDIPGAQFKEMYNLRAPGYLRIPQSGFAFFNIEKK